MPINLNVGRNATFGRIGLSVAAALPFLLSLVFHAVGASGQPARETGSRAALAFDYYMVDLGEAPPSTFAVAEFHFANRSDRTVTIRDLEPSCGCLTPRLEKRVYEPNEAGRFTLRVQTANEEPGPKQYWLKMRYEDAEPREVELTFKVVLPQEKVVVKPKALIFYQFGSQPTTQEITVIDYRGRTLQITGVECSSPLAQVDVGEADTDDEGNHRQRVAITVSGSVPPGRHHAVVTVATSDPVYQNLQVPLLIEGLEPKAARRNHADEDKH